MLKKPRPAFTLIELLVVVAIIAILVGMLIPALARAREEARKMKCRSALHNMGTAMAQYVDMFGKGRFYSWPGTQAPIFNGAQWIASLYWSNLLAEREQYVCPSSADDNDNGGELGRKFTALRDIDVSYAGRNGLIGVIVDKMESNTTMMCDDSDGTQNHDEGVNLMFFDAHVEYSGNLKSTDVGKTSPIDMLRD
ncbi:MAG: type II secretion system protein [Planctomycetes bacterium]|nr:type II secretion system protein [Planctomycetota bacterium]